MAAVPPMTTWREATAVPADLARGSASEKIKHPVEHPEGPRVWCAHAPPSEMRRRKKESLAMREEGDKKESVLMAQ